MKNSLRSKVLSLVLVLAVMLPSAVVYAARPPSINFYISGFNGAKISVSDENNNRIMYSEDWIPQSKYMKPGTKLTITWQVNESTPYTILVNDNVYTSEESKITLTTPLDGSIYEFELINHDEIDNMIKLDLTDKIIPLDQRQTKFAALSDLSIISWKIVLDKTITDVKYSISNNGLKTKEKNVPSKADWKIHNPKLTIGENLLQITVSTLYGKQYKKTFTIFYGDDTDADKDGLPCIYEQIIDLLHNLQTLPLRLIFRNTASTSPSIYSSNMRRRRFLVLQKII